MASVRGAAAPVVDVCLAADPPALVVACGLVVSLGLDDRWPLAGLLERCMDLDQWSLAESVVDAHATRHAAGAASGGAAAEGEGGEGLGEMLVRGAIERRKFKQVPR